MSGASRRHARCVGFDEGRGSTIVPVWSVAWFGREFARGRRLLRTPVGASMLSGGVVLDLLGTPQADSVRQHVLERVRIAGAPPKEFSQEEAARSVDVRFLA